MKKREKEETKREDEKESVSDVFDVLELASRVHTPTDILTRDFNLAITEKHLETLCSRLTNLSLMMYKSLERSSESRYKSDLNRPERIDEEEYETEEKEIIDETRYEQLAEVKEIAESIKKLIRHEVIMRLKFTQSRDGTVLKALLKAPYAHLESEDETKEGDSEGGFFKKLFSGKKKEMESETL